MRTNISTEDYMRAEYGHIVTEGDAIPEFLRDLGVVKIETTPLMKALHGQVYPLEDDDGNKTYIIQINSRRTEMERFKAFIHELLHVMLLDHEGERTVASEQRLYATLGIEHGIDLEPCDLMSNPDKYKAYLFKILGLND